jgi:hypothetical protein
MATLRVGTLTPTALKMGTVTVVAAYLGTTAVWPLVGGFTATLGGVGKQATGSINATHALSPDFIGTVNASGKQATGAINATFAVPTLISYRLFNGTTDALSVNLGNLALANSVPETWIVACRINVPIIEDGEIVHSYNFNPLDLYVWRNAGLWRLFDGTVDHTNGPAVSALDAIVVVRRGTGTNVRWAMATHNGTVWSGFAYGDDTTVSASGPYPAAGGVSGLLDIFSNPPVGGRLAAIARANTALSDAEVATLTGSLDSWQAIASVTNLWRLDQTPVVDVVGTATQNTLTGTTVPGTFPLNSTGGAGVAVTGTLPGVGKRATGAVNATVTDAFTAALPTASGKQATAVINGALSGVPAFGTLPGVGKQATGAITGSFTTRPSPPTLVSATPGNTIVDLVWTAGADGFSAITNYLIERGPNGVSSWVTVATVAATPTTYTDTGRTNGTTYYYQVSAINALGLGLPSNALSAIPGSISGTLPGVGKKATGTINGLAGATHTATVAGSGKQATGAINATAAGASSGFAKYRTFAGTSSSHVRFNLGNLSGTSSNPQTLVFVGRVTTPGADGEIICAPGFAPMDFFYHPPNEAWLYDGAQNVFVTGFTASDGWCLLAIRSLVGAAAKTSRSSAGSGSTWPTPTHATSITTLGVNTWPTSGLITVGDGTADGDAPFFGDIVCIARFNTALSDAQINAMTGGVAVIQGTTGITNLWMLGQATPADLVGTSTLSAVTGTTLSTTDSPFPT